MKMKGSLSTVAVILLLAGLLPLIGNAESQPPTRAPDKYGHISSDETWDDPGDHTLWVDDIIIDGRVTVTIAAGMNIMFYPGAYFWVRGTLLVQGTTGKGEVDFGEISGNPWDGIVINETGNARMKNFTVQSATGPSIHLMGGKNLLENGVITGSKYSIYVSGSDGDNVIRNIVSRAPTAWGFVKIESEVPTLVENMRVFNSGGGGIGIEKSTNATMRNIYVNDPGLYYSWIISSSNVHFNDYQFQDTSWDNVTIGLAFTGFARDCTFENGYMEGLNRAVSIWTDEASNIRVKDLVTHRSVVEGIIGQGMVKMNAEFIDCQLDVSDNLTRLDVSEPGLYMDLINTTWDSNDNILIANEAVLNVSWYLEAEVIDGNGDPLDTNFRIMWEGGGKPLNEDHPDGIIEQMPIMYSTQKGMARPKTFSNDYQFQSNDYPTNTYRINGFIMNMNTRWDIMMDLAPFNNLPGSLSVNEDEWLDLDLDEYFTDPEGLEMDYVFEHSDNLTVVRTGGPGSGDLRIKNAQPDWFGTGWLMVTATDTGMNETSKNVTINVLPVNDAPYFTETIPTLVVEEDGWTYYNFTDKVADVEGDEVTLSFLPDAGIDIEYNGTLMNLTIWPVDDVSGLFSIKVILSDEDALTHEMITVNVTPVNDPPEALVRYENGTEAPREEVPLTDTENVTAYVLELDEDTSIKFWLDATDVDSTNLTYRFVADDLEHGTIVVEVKQVEVIVNETSNQTAWENVTVPMNFTYTPYANDHAGDLVRFIVSDGEADITLWVWFDVAPVNDPPVLDVPDEWNITVDLDERYALDLEGMLSDVDGDTLVISTGSEYALVNGTEITFLYNNTFTGESEDVEITVSDGTATRTWMLTANVIWPADDDDDDESTLGTLEVIGEEDRWVFEVEGSVGQDLWVVVEDEDGEKTSYKMTYQDGKYSAEVPKEDAEEGFDYWVSTSENGESVDPSMEGVLPALEEEDKEKGSQTCLICSGIVIVLVILVLLVIILLAVRRKGHPEESEE
ncbi:MAG: right-handed parallel beta-helix repeat-containing protein [Candidatus Thermoplasmatota archaeon]|nr:right-handed parallel beta-helix repeat-containing protein [Candidatus Thermoplasmatota archaeon]